MGSVSNLVVPQSSEEQACMGDSHSKDLEHSNNTQRELSQDYYKPRSLTILEHSLASSTTALETSDNEPANFIKSKPDDPEPTSSKNNLNLAASVSKETPDKVDEVFTKNQTVSTVKHSKDQHLSKEANTIQPDLFEETELIQSTVLKVESTKVIQQILSMETDIIQQTPFEQTELTEIIQPALSEEVETTEVFQSPASKQSESIEVNQPALAEEMESIRVNQPALAEEMESIRINQPALAEEMESIRINQPALAEEMESIRVNQPALAEEKESIRVNQPALAEEIESIRVIQPIHSEVTEVKQSVISQEVDLNKEIPFSSLESNGDIRALISSTDTKKVKISSNDIINLSAEPELVSKGSSKNVVDLSDPEENSNSSFPPVLDTDSFLSLLNTEEYKNASHFMIAGAGQVLVSPVTRCEPFFPDFKMPPLLPATLNPSMASIEHLSPNKGSIVTKDICSKKSLSTLLSMFADWVQRGMEKFDNCPKQPDIVYFIDYYKSGLEYGIDLLKQMLKRLDNLLRAVDCLPDPSSILPRELRSEKISIRNRLKVAGEKVQLRLEALEAETTENYSSLVSLCSSDAKLGDEFDNILAIDANYAIFNSFNKLSDDFVRLCMDIENFRDHIRYFCLEMDRFL